MMKHEMVRAIVVVDRVDREPYFQMEVELRYDTRDPYAVIIRFSREAKWFVARDLLAAGLEFRWAGMGDVRIMPCEETAEVMLLKFCTDKISTFSVNRQDIADFLNRTVELVRPEYEHLWADWDKELQILLP